MLTKIELDQMEHYQIAANGIEPAGLARIAELLEGAGIPAEIMENVEPVWATKRGTFPKRLAKVLRRSGYAAAATPALMGAIGQVAADNSSRTDEYWFQVDSRYTDDESGFPYERGEHGDDGSCYHPGGQYAHAPYDIEHAGGMLLRTFEPATPGTGYYFDFSPGEPFQYYAGIARCFIIPCTYYAGDEGREGIVMINGYCQNGYSHDLLHLARLIATAEGLAYRKVSVRDLFGRIFVNGDSGYLLGEWENIHNVRSVDICVKDSGRTPSKVMFSCDSCGQGYEEEDLTVIGDSLICPDCLQIDYLRCERCGEWTLKRIAANVAGEWWCKHCTDTYSVTCARCGSRSPRAYAYYVGQECWCEDCYDQHAVECAGCGNYYAPEELSKENGRYFCRECSRLMCCACGETIENPIRVEGWPYCSRCAPV
jgi:formylmethanofuran dehydrogenase subunit E